MKLQTIELFCGSATISQAFEKKGHAVFSVDIRKRKGVCEPTLRKDVLDLTARDLSFQKYQVLWASPPCDVWSYAAGNKHWQGNIPLTEKAALHQRLMLKTMQLIDELDPAVWFIENPRGRLRYWPPFVKWLKQKNATCLTLTLSSYGFSTTKPTNLFTNSPAFPVKELDRFGRGAKVKGRFDNLTRCQRQKTPPALAEEIVKYCEGLIWD